MTNVDKIINIIDDQLEDIKQELKSVELKPWNNVNNTKYNILCRSV